jgi:Clp amino terminal domain, pathogenicity island component
LAKGLEEGGAPDEALPASREAEEDGFVVRELRWETGKSGPEVLEGRLPFTPRAIAVFNGALASALEMGHNYLGTEHLLIGLARGDGLAVEVLTGFGLAEEGLVARITAELAGYQAGEKMKKATVRGRATEA